MKLLTPAVVAIAILFTLASCGKMEYTCQCKISNGSTTPLTEELDMGKITNNAAQKRCNNHQLNRANELKSSGQVIQCKVVNL
jgi:hypothetical protein